MKHWIWSWVGVFALLVLPLVGCSGSTDDGTGGDAGAGGTAGSGGSAGSGGAAGTGGAGGSSSASHLWTGSGQGDGADGPFVICFNVRADGNALVPPSDPSSECGWSLAVEFENCEGGKGGFATADEIPIVDGAFMVDEQFRDISGTIDGNTASGEVAIQTCSGSWEATPSQ